METAMRLQELYDVEQIRNGTRELVYERVERLLEEREDICKCETCVLDLVAFILNRVTPRYRTSMLGDLHPDEGLQKKIQVEIDLAVRAGLKQLRAHPHHG
jgi:competence protein ComFB